jgi:hypothetical protein
MTEGSSQAYADQNLYWRIKRRHNDYVDRRRKYDAQRDVICELLRPDLVAGSKDDKPEGAFQGSKIVEGTGPHAALTWQRGFMANMISRKSIWFREKLREPPKWTGVTFDGNDEVNRYCQDLADHMFDVYRRSNYYDVMPEFVLNAGTVGSPAMLFEQDWINDRIICKVPHYGDVWLDKDIFGRDNALHVRWEWTALEAESFFGFDQLPATVQNHLKSGSHYTKTAYLQVIYGAGDRIYGDLKDPVPQVRPWLEHFICLKGGDAEDQEVLVPLNRGPGYFARPFATWHYHRNWHEVYGRTMAWWAVYDLRGLNAMWEALFSEAELAVRPATWAMSALRGMLDLGPGGDNWARSGSEYDNPPQYLERKTRYDVAIDFSDRVKDAVQRHFHYPLFMAVNQIIDNKTQPETAFALMKAEAEEMGQLAPQVETYENQVLGHAHEVFMDAERMAEPAYPWGRLPEPPAIAQEFSDGEVEIEYLGRLSMAQIRDREIMKSMRAIGTSQMVAELVPNTIHKVRWSETLERLLESQDFNQDEIVPEDEYQKIVETINQRAMQQELMENAPKMAKAVQSLQRTTEKGSPLAALSGAKE